MKRAVLFDLDGTLLDTLDDLADSMNAALERTGFPSHPVSSYRYFVGDGVDVLVMTATPIPRTLTLTAYGDMDVSRMTEKPPGRKPIDTRLISFERYDDIVANMKNIIQQKQQVYWVCPLIEETENTHLSNSNDRFRYFKSYFWYGCS